MSSNVLNIGLVAAYSGTNLGDQAIQSACIKNLRRLRPDINLTGIYLNTWRPRRLHEIDTFPITGLEVPFYSNSYELFGSPEIDEQEREGRVSTEHPSKRGFKDSLKQSRLICWGVRLIRRVMASASNILREGLWMLRAWRLVRSLDLVLVAGSGQIDEEWGGAWGQPYALYKWALICRVAGCRFAVASVGVSDIRGGFSRFFFRQALRQAVYVSCRDEDSVKRLHNMLGGDAPRMISDLALTLPDLIGARSKSAVSDRVVAISPIAFGRKGSWPTEALDAYENYIENLSAVVANLLADGWEIEMFSTSGADGRAISDVLEVLQRMGGCNMSHLTVRRPKTLEQLFSSISGCAYVIASRLHGVILSHLLEKPVLAISFDPKVEAHLRQFKQIQYCIDIRSVKKDDVLSTFNLLIRDEGAARATIREIREQLLPDLRAQYDSIIHLASGSV